MAKPAAKQNTWFQEHSHEVWRGVVLGIALGILVCVFAWKPSPNPVRGETQEQVIARFGQPDQILERSGPALGEGVFPLRQLVYYTGLFNSSETIIMINTGNNKVMNVAVDGDLQI